MKIKNKIIFSSCLLMGTMLIGCEKDEISIQHENNIKIENGVMISKDFKELFTYEPISDEVYNKMIGNSIPYEGLVNIEELSYLKLSYYGFDGEPNIGEMIVGNEVAQEVLDIFKELYDNKYPIEKINLIDEYDANDEKSMSDNNTSAFCYREVAGSNKLSNHSKGLAIDINPLINPMVKGEIVSPEGGRNFLNREDITKGMITKGDICYEAFTKRGWTWGGEWNSLKDYQHFEKKN